MKKIIIHVIMDKIIIHVIMDEVDNYTYNNGWR